MHIVTVDEPKPARDLDSARRRAVASFLEMPGLQLTIPQAARLWGLDAEVCGHVLAELVDAGFLMLTRREMFLRT